MDSAFRRSNYPYLIKSAQDCVVDSDGTIENTNLLHQAKPARKASKWDMGSFNSMFPTLLDWFVCKERGERKIVLLTLVILHKLRSRLFGINQILNPYMSQ